MDFGKKVVELDVNDILPNRFQPRIKFNEDSINELCDSIREHGIIQPIVVRKMGDKYEIIAGERRFKACLLVGKNSIPAIVTELNDKDSAEVALIENVQRRDLTPIEEAISYKKILDMGYLTQEDLANKLGKTQSTVANKLRLLNLTEDVQEALLEEKISERHARSLLKISDPVQQRKMLEKIMEGRLTVRKTEEAISKLLKGEDIFYQENVKNNNINVEIPNNDIYEKDINKQTNNYNELINNNIINPNLNKNEFEDTPIQNDYNNNFMSTISSNIDNKFDNNSENEFNQFIPPNDITKENNNNILSPIYNNQENDEIVVPSFEGNKEDIIPVIPSIDNKVEEPVVIIEKEPTMNNNSFMNINNNQTNSSNNNEFNPFDMMNNVPNNEFNIPTSGIEDSPKMNSDNSFQSINNNYSIEEPTIITPEVNNNNPGFLDIDRIKNEAVDINSILQNNDSFEKPKDNINNYNQNINNEYKPEKPILRTSENSNSYVEDEPILKPGKFFDLPLEDESDKNEEIKLNNNPFDFNVDGDLSNMKLNTEGHPKFKTLDEINQFREPVSNEIPSMINQKNEINNNNPVNQFGLPIQEEYNTFNYNNNIVKPTNTPIPPIEQQNQASYMGNSMMSSQIPSNKNINLAYDAIKECVNKIKGLGFNVNTEDFDFENMYQIMFRIEK